MISTFKSVYPLLLVVTLLPICAIAQPGRAAAPAASQPPTAATPAPLPEFEAASVRMANAHSLDDLQRGIGRSSVSPFPTNLFTARFVPLSVIISIAYGLDGSRISGKPEWMNDQLYDVSARVDGDAILTVDQMRPVLQKLLEQRFRLAAHREIKLVQGYALIAAKGGPKLQPGKGRDKPFYYILPNGLEAQGATLSVFAGMLERPAGRPVIDKTGIAGNYDIKVRYAPAEAQKSDLPDFFTSLQEQLGLKLESQRIPLDYLVIDHVERTPTVN